MLTTFFKAAHTALSAIRFAGHFGRRRLIVNFVFILINGLVQVLGVASIAPFLAAASSGGSIPSLGKLPVAGPWLAGLVHRDLLIVLGFITIFGLFFANFLMWLTERVRLRYGAFLIHVLRKGLMENYCGRPYGFFLATNSSVLLKRLTQDTFQFVNGVLVPSLEILSRSVVLILLLVLLLLVAPGLTLLVACFCGIIYGGSLAVLSGRGRRLGQQMNSANKAMFQAAQQFFGAIKAILLHSKTSYFANQFLDASFTCTSCSARAGLLGNMPRYLLEPVAFGTLVGAVLLQVSDGHALASILPKLSILALAGYRLLPSFQAIYGQAMNVISSAYTIAEVADCVYLGTTAGNPHQPSIHFTRSLQLERVAFSYPGASVPVFHNISLEFPRNSKTGIIGSTGSGKSTLVDLILGLHSPTNGRVLVDGMPLNGENLISWRALIGYVPQDIYLLDDTIAANIALGVPEAERDLKKLREVAGAAHILELVEKDLPHGFSTMVGERGVRLSGGQRQRIGIARALYHSPSILVLDEATSALDAETEQSVMDAIYELSGKITMIMIAHRRSSLDRCDRIVDLSKVETSTAKTRGVSAATNLVVQ